MIVIDTNVIAYLLIEGKYTQNTRRLVLEDSEWYAPILWRSEFLNVLSKQMRFADLTLSDAALKFEKATLLLAPNEQASNPEQVLALIEESDLTAYDCEYVALAMELDCKLVTMDKKIISEFPNIAVSLLDF